MATTLKVSTLVLFLIVSQFVYEFARGVSSFSRIQFLPGFNGSLPFRLETGYIGVEEGEEVQLFYYFVESENKPKEDPLLLWLTGGPGCSAATAFFYEIGPLKFEKLNYNGNLPTLSSNHYSWTKLASIIFVDLPVGTGFSYATTSRASVAGDYISSRNIHEFLRKWLINHPKFLSNPVYIGGDSYSGIPLPISFLDMVKGNEKGLEPFINLKGYLLGNPMTNFALTSNSDIPFAHGMGLISDELYESLKRSCKGNYEEVDPTNMECLNHVQTFHDLVSRVNPTMILEPNCGYVHTPLLHGRRSMYEHITSKIKIASSNCRDYGYTLVRDLLNDQNVREALHVRKGTIGYWQRCNTLNYTVNVKRAERFHAKISAKGYRSLIYSGDHDYLVPFMGTQAWIRSLNYSIVDDWRPWMVDGQVAGYARTYANRMTFATVKGAGHTAPEYKPKECEAMFRRWISEQPL